MTGAPPPERGDVSAPLVFNRNSLNPEIFKLVTDCVHVDPMVRPSAHQVSQVARLVSHASGDNRSACGQSTCSRGGSLAHGNSVQTQASPLPIPPAAKAPVRPLAMIQWSLSAIETVPVPVVHLNSPPVHRGVLKRRTSLPVRALSRRSTGDLYTTLSTTALAPSGGSPIVVSSPVKPIFALRRRKTINDDSSIGSAYDADSTTERLAVMHLGVC